MPLYRIDGKEPQVADDCWIAPSADLVGEVVLGAQGQSLALDRGDALVHDRPLRVAHHVVDGEHLDATLLLLAELGFVRPDDPRFIATVDAVGNALRRGDLLLRYDVEDDFGRMHTAFMICGFWYVDALNAIGRKEEAVELFERILNLRNSFGLFSEDADFTTGELWGNFPQTYSMVGLINSAVRLSRSWEEAF